MNARKKQVKELWESLEQKYKTKDNTTKFVLCCFSDYKMMDSKTVTSPVQEL